jgi:pimeloyl-ACP methyl ester carboxylesterase
MRYWRLKKINMLRFFLCLVLYLSSHIVRAQVIDTLIEVGAHKLHFKIIKGNNTQILFESGGGITLAQWDSIVTPVHSLTGATIITYDRQGFGTSGLDTANYTILNEIKGVETGLRKLGYGSKPMLLVGHSLGAFYSRVYASRNVALTKGIIMLDPRIPSFADMAFARSVYHTLDSVTLKKESFALYYVLANMERNSDFVRRIPIKPGLPILNVMAETGPFDSISDNERFQSDQRSFVKEGSNRVLLLAKGSTHNIPQDQPQLVIDQIVSFYKKHLD